MTDEAVIHGERIISSSVYHLLDFLFYNRRKVLQTPLGRTDGGVSHNQFSCSK